MAISITMPQLSDTMSEGTLVKWLKKEGDKIKANEVIAEIETDKATMEMESTDAGTLAVVLVKEGQKAPVGGAIALLATGKETIEDVRTILRLVGQGAPSSAVPVAPSQPVAQIQITMPRFDDTMVEGTLVKWLKKVGDKVKAKEPIAEVETDKATMELESTDAGTLAAVLVKEGQKVPVGAVLALLTTGKQTLEDLLSKARHKSHVAPPSAAPIAPVLPAPPKRGGPVVTAPAKPVAPVLPARAPDSPPAIASAGVTASGHDLFLSYSSKDDAIAKTVCGILEAQGLRCWVAPRDVVPGARWGASIIEAITAAPVMVVLFSTSSNESTEVMKEVERASSKRVAIIPFRIENIVPTGDMEYHLSHLHWLDAFTSPIESHIPALVRTVRRLLESRAASRRAVGAARPEPPRQPPSGGIPRRE